MSTSVIPISPLTDPKRAIVELEPSICRRDRKLGDVAAVLCSRDVILRGFALDRRPGHVARRDSSQALCPGELTASAFLVVWPRSDVPVDRLDAGWCRFGVDRRMLDAAVAESSGCGREGKPVDLSWHTPFEELDSIRDEFEVGDSV